MNMDKLNPWNWFKHETGPTAHINQMPVSRKEAEAPVRSDLGLYPMLKFHQDIDRIFDDVFSRVGLPGLRTGFGAFPSMESSEAMSFTPSIDVSGDEKNYQIVLDVPGMKEEDLSVDLTGNKLTIRGNKEESSEQDDKQFYRAERYTGSFQRTLSLPEDANASDINATLKDGVLTLAIPREPGERSGMRRIPISK